MPKIPRPDMAGWPEDLRTKRISHKHVWTHRSSEPDPDGGKFTAEDGAPGILLGFMKDGVPIPTHRLGQGSRHYEVLEGSHYHGNIKPGTLERANIFDAEGFVGKQVGLQKPGRGERGH